MARRRVKVRKDDTVKIHYTCKLTDGTVVESSVKGKPIEFVVGKGGVIKGLDEAVAKMKIGETNTIRVAPEKAYGPRREEWVLEAGRDRFSEDWRPEVGLHFEIPGENSESRTATVTRVSSSTVTLDFNHPLAGKELIFEVSLLEIV
jgi:peptidylprolyl isomerase